MNHSMVGSKIPINISIDGLGDNLSLSDERVSIKATFYAYHVLEYGEKIKSVTYEKKDMKPAYEGECNDYICLVDTSSLSHGRLTGAIEISYPTQVGTAVEKIREEVIDVPLYDMDT